MQTSDYEWLKEDFFDSSLSGESTQVPLDSSSFERSKEKLFASFLSEGSEEGLFDSSVFEDTPKEPFNPSLSEESKEEVLDPSFLQEIDKDDCEPSALTALMRKEGVEGSPEPDNSLHEEKKVKRGKKGLLKRSLQPYKSYLKRRVEETATRPVVARRFFEEIKAQGYEGAFNTVQKFVSAHRGTITVPFEGSLDCYKDYLKNRVESGGELITRELFKEIKAQGYQGGIRQLQVFISAIRQRKDASNEASLTFHKEYLKKRIEEAGCTELSGKQLLAEIQNRGYPGSASAAKSFFSMLRSMQAPKALIQNYKDYIVHRLEEAAPKDVPTKQLLEEIRAQGYRGTLRTLQIFLSTIRKKAPPEALLEFHKSYLTDRVRGDLFNNISKKQLFKEITARGYRGKMHTMSVFLSAISEKKGIPVNSSLQFYKDYLKKRVKEASPKPSIRQLFEEIRSAGYQGKIETLQKFLLVIGEKKERPVGASLDFHKSYLENRVKEIWPKRAPKNQLFEEIVARGYREGFNALKRFMVTIQPNKRSLPEAFLPFHEDYLTKRIQNSWWPSSITAKHLFEDIKLRGYQGSLRTVQRFLTFTLKGRM